MANETTSNYTASEVAHDIVTMAPRAAGDQIDQRLDKVSLAYPRLLHFLGRVESAFSPLATMNNI